MFGKRCCLRIGAGSPVVAILLLLWADVFNLSQLLLGKVVEPRQVVVEVRPAPAEAPRETTTRPAKAGGAGERRDCALHDVPALRERWEQVTEQRKSGMERVRARGGRGPQGAAAKRRRVGASVAVHPPKFYAASRFLEDWYFCPAAFEVLSVVLVFSKEGDLQIFREAQACMSPEVPDEAWTGVVAMAPVGGWHDGSGSTNQLIAAYKKWYGAAHMMDSGPEAPDYGMMLDSEVVLYTSHAAGATGGACKPGGAWAGLFDRIAAQDAARAFPAARVSATHTTYDFGAYKRSGQDYDRILIGENARFAMADPLCKTAGCMEVRRQEQECLWSWWTDVPWMNLTVARRMLEGLAKKPAANGYRDLSRALRFTRFEHVAYQQWSVIHEGFHFRDVTNLTGEAKWGSYLEDPLDGARLDELQPMWISMKALLQAETGKIPALSQDAPPLLIFHADHAGPRFYNRVDHEKAVWEDLVLGLLKRHGRRDFDKQTIQ